MMTLAAGVSLGYVVATIGPKRLAKALRQSFKK